MKRIISLALTLSLCLPAAWAAPEQLPAVDLVSSSAVLMEKETGQLLYEKEAHQRMEPASVTKIMTLLLIMEALDAGRIRREDPVTISSTAAGMGGSQVYLEEGEQMSAGALIKCITGTEAEFDANYDEMIAELEATGLSEAEQMMTDIIAEKVAVVQ